MDDDTQAPGSTDVSQRGSQRARRRAQHDVDHLALVLGTRRVCPEEHAFLARAYLQAAVTPQPR